MDNRGRGNGVRQAQLSHRVDIEKTSDYVAGLGWFPFVRVDHSSDSRPIVRVGNDRAEWSEPSDRRSVL